jgi:periplasmic protein TonB
MSASISIVDYYSGAARRNKLDLLIGVLCAVAIIAGTAWIGELLRSGPPKPKKEVIPPAVQIVMPDLTPQQVVQDTQEQQAPADIAPPMQTDMPQIVTDTSFVQPLQPSPPSNLQMNTGAITIPANAGGFVKGMQVFDINKLDQIPEAVYRPEPTYPYEMRKQGISGQVVVQFIVDSQGNVLDAFAVSSTQHDFEEPAVQAVSRWKFRPGRKDGRAVATRMEIPIVFSLEND